MLRTQAIPFALKEHYQWIVQLMLMDISFHSVLWERSCLQGLNSITPALSRRQNDLDPLTQVVESETTCHIDQRLFSIIIKHFE